MTLFPRRLSIRPLIAAVALGTTALAGIAGGAIAADQQVSSQARQPLAPANTAVAGAKVHDSLADMVDSVGPSVVQIQVKPEARMRWQSGGVPSGSENEDLSDRLGRLFGFQGPGFPDAPQQRGPQRGALGSGFIVDESGLVITNNHVVRGADRITVQMSDGRELPGRVLGRDPMTDVAVVQIEAKGSFKPIQWANSDQLRVGDSIFAVGSPFGLGNTVTSGIVSARSREIGAGPYDDFLQVDAAINSGNSGGPLFDGAGRVVGVNTAIFSPSGGNVGIGFAIPANMARDVAMKIAENGHVSRGRIGVSLQDVTPDIAASIGLGDHKGAWIAGVEANGPAAQSGLRRGDIIRQFGDSKVDDSGDLARAVADAKIGSRVPVGVIRDGRQVRIDLRVGGDDTAQS